MKVVKIVKYSYALTEKTLEKDIDKFISDTRKGVFGGDSKHRGEALKIIKQYFRFIQEKFEKKKFEECVKCYKKLILFLFDSSTGRDEADLGYEDLLSKVSKDFGDLIKKYFICLVEFYSDENLANECYDYIIKLKEYGFDSDKEILINHLERSKLNNLINLLLLKAEGMTQEDEDKQDVIYFLMEIFEELGEKEKYLNLCKRFEGVLSKKEVEYLKDGYEEGGGDFNKVKEEGLWENKTKINGVWVNDETGEEVRE